jgi:anaerobic selenocysteine-containing dehydrogenase
MGAQYRCQRRPYEFIEIHPDDAKARGIVSGDLVAIENDHVLVQTRAYVGVDDNELSFTELQKAGHIRSTTAASTPSPSSPTPSGGPCQHAVKRGAEHLGELLEQDKAARHSHRRRWPVAQAVRRGLGHRAVPRRRADVNTRARLYVSPSLSIVSALPMSPRWVRT